MRTILVVANETLGGRPLLEAVRRARPGGADALHRLRARARSRGTATSSTTTRSSRRRRSASTSRAPSCARRASTSSARSATPTRTRRRWTPSGSTTPTRSSSRPSRPRPRAGCAATSSSASASGGRARASTSSPTSTSRGPALRRHARGRQPHDDERAAVRGAARARQGRARTCSSSSSPRRAARASPAARRRRRLTQLVDRMRAEGLLAGGMIGDPDPYIATMNALNSFRVDDIVISTLPVHAVGLAARRPHRARAQGLEQAGRARRRRVRRRGGLSAMEAAAVHAPRTSTTGRRRPTAARGSSPSCWGCCFSSSPR